jgi:hypothetical protein
VSVLIKLTVQKSKSIANINRPRWFLVFAVLFKFLLGLSYAEFVVPVFDYYGYSLNVDFFKYSESWLAFLVLVFFSPKKLTKPSDYLINVLVFTYLCPLLVLYGLSGADRATVYIVLVATALIFIFRQGRYIYLPHVRSRKAAVYGLLFSGVAIVTVWMLFSGGLRYFNLDFSLVYEYRRDAGDAINQGVMSYLNIWATKVFGPVLLALFLWKNKYLLAGLVIVLHILWFGISSHKSVLLYPFVITFLWAWFRNTGALSLIPLGMSLVVTSAFLLYVLYDEVLVSSLLIRRAFFTPAKLTYDYYEFFALNPFVYWSNSVASYFIDYPYQLSPSMLIGEYIGTEGNANNSFLATGYIHAGIPGVLFYGLLVGLLFRLIDSLARASVPVWIAVAAVIVPSYSLITSADLLTALLTHGIGVSLVVLFFLRSAFGVATEKQVILHR